MCGFSHKSPNFGREFAVHGDAQVKWFWKTSMKNNPKKLQLGVLAPLLRNKDRLTKRLGKGTRDGNAAARPAKRRQ
jgi:riboflavin synthase